VVLTASSIDSWWSEVAGGMLYLEIICSFANLKAEEKSLNQLVLSHGIGLFVSGCIGFGFPLAFWLKLSVMLDANSISANYCCRD
jgi:hypothetical protein